jgi:hypothetical protein
MTMLQVIGAGILWMVCVGVGAVASFTYGGTPYRGRDAVRGALWGGVFATYEAMLVLGVALLSGWKP